MSMYWPGESAEKWPAFLCYTNEELEENFLPGRIVPGSFSGHAIFLGHEIERNKRSGD